MIGLNITRLALKLEGLSGREGDRLVHLIGDELAAIKALGRPVSIDKVEISVLAKPGDNVEAIARQIVDQLVRQVSTL